MRTKPKKTWLITKGNGASPQTEVVDILSLRCSVRDVQKYVERLHNIVIYTMWERAELAAYNKPREPAYPATIYPFSDRSRGIEIHCGHDPYFIARPVHSLGLGSIAGLFHRLTFRCLSHDNGAQAMRLPTQRWGYRSRLAG